MILGAINRAEDSKSKQSRRLGDIQTLINERDMLISGVLNEIVTKPPKEQLARINSLRSELMKKDREISVAKAQYDVLASAIVQQNLIAQSLQYSRENSPYFVPGSGGRSAPGRGTTVPKDGRTTFFNVLEWLVPTAHAAPQKQLIDFITGMGRFTSDLESRVQSLKDEERQVFRELQAAYKARAQSITPQTARDLDTETLIEMQLYSETLRDETSSLIEKSQDKNNPSALAANVKNVLVEARDSSNEAITALNELSFQFRDSYPLSSDDNAEAWWSLVPGAMIQE